MTNKATQGSLHLSPKPATPISPTQINERVHPNSPYRQPVHHPTCRIHVQPPRNRFHDPISSQNISASPTSHARYRLIPETLTLQPEYMHTRGIPHATENTTPSCSLPPEGDLGPPSTKAIRKRPGAFRNRPACP